jgi:preprotein translocase subunit YajC
VTELVSFLPLVAIALLFWLMVVRPASRRQKNLARIQSQLQPGQRVMLSSGIFGTVTSVADDRVRVEIAPGVEVEVVRPAIGSVETVEDEGPGTAPGTDPDSES